MKLRISRLLAITAFVVSCLVDSTQTLAQNAYITSIGNSNNGAVSVINTVTDAVIATIPLNGGTGVAATRTKVYVAAGTGLVVIDTATNKVVATVPVGADPTDSMGVAASPNRNKVYVTNFSSNSVSVIDAATDAVIATVPVGTNPYAVAVSPDGGKIYVANAHSQSVSVIDAATNAVIDTIPIPASAGVIQAMATAPDGGKVYVLGWDFPSRTNNSMSVIDAARDTVTATITIPTLSPAPETFPLGVAVSPDSRKIYVTTASNKGPNMGTAGTVLVFAAATDAVIAEIDVGNEPQGVAVTPDGSKVYVANSDSATVSVINTATNAVIATIPVGINALAFGLFIQPAPQFAGTPGKANCYGRSVSALARQYHGLNAAAAALGFSSVSALQNAILAFCESCRPTSHGHDCD
jgi:YVTN family beta-propeller protein